MKRLIYLFVICLIQLFAQAQETTHVEMDEEIICDPIFDQPDFPGGRKALFQYLTDSLRYPEIAIKNNIEGRVICQFKIRNDGSITDVEVVRTSGYSMLDSEAIRLVESMPNWKPGTMYKEGGIRIIIATKYTLPVNFKLPSSLQTKNGRH